MTSAPDPFSMAVAVRGGGGSGWGGAVLHSPCPLSQREQPQGQGTALTPVLPVNQPVG